MVVQDELAVDRFAVAGDGIHMMQRDAAPDGGKGVAREVEVRDGIEHEMRAVGAQRGQRTVLVVRQLVKADARHRFFDQCVCVRQREQQLGQLLAVVFRDAAAHADKIGDEPLAQLDALRDGLGGQLRQVADLHALLAQNVGKGVMLRLRAAQVGNIVKEQTLQSVRNKLLQLAAGALEKDFFQRANLALHLNCHTDASSQNKNLTNSLSHKREKINRFQTFFA